MIAGDLTEESKSYRKRRTTKTELFGKILKEIDGSNRKIKFASATFHRVQMPEVKVNMKQ